MTSIIVTGHRQSAFAVHSVQFRIRQHKLIRNLQQSTALIHWMFIMFCLKY